MKRSRDNRKLVRVQTAKPQSVARRLFNEIQPLVETVRTHVAQNVNAGLVVLYWKIGVILRKDLLGEERAEYGEKIVSTLSRRLTAVYGSGFSSSGLTRMMLFSDFVTLVRHEACVETTITSMDERAIQPSCRSG